MSTLYLNTRNCSEDCQNENVIQPAICDIYNWYGRVNQLSLIRCSEDFDPTTLADITKWQNMVRQC